VRRILLAVYGIAIFSSPSIADSPYENAAKLDMEHLASSILAASVCKGVRFNGDAPVTSLTAAFVLLGRKHTEDAFFSAMSANIDEMSAKGKEAWCAQLSRLQKNETPRCLPKTDAKGDSEKRPSTSEMRVAGQIHYSVSAAQPDCHLVPVDRRVFSVPTSRV
jgi:hypothetical protein